MWGGNQTVDGPNSEVDWVRFRFLQLKIEECHAVLWGQVMSPELNPDSELRKVNASKSMQLGDFPAG